MGLLDSVVGMLGQNQPGGAGAGGNAALISAVIGMLANNNQGSSSGGALGGLGGLAGLVSQLQQSGLGDIVASWVSTTGQNLPVSPGQLHNALGDDAVGALSQQTGLQQGDLLSQLSQILPQVVDQLTPQGQVPAQDDLGDLSNVFGAFLKR